MEDNFAPSLTPKSLKIDAGDHFLSPSGPEIDPGAGLDDFFQFFSVFFIFCPDFEPRMVRLGVPCGPKNGPKIDRKTMIVCHPTRKILPRLLMRITPMICLESIGGSELLCQLATNIPYIWIRALSSAAAVVCAANSLTMSVLPSNARVF